MDLSWISQNRAQPVDWCDQNCHLPVRPSRSIVLQFPSRHLSTNGTSLVKKLSMPPLPTSLHLQSAYPTNLRSPVLPPLPIAMVTTDGWFLRRILSRSRSRSRIWRSRERVSSERKGKITPFTGPKTEKAGEPTVESLILASSQAEQNRGYTACYCPTCPWLWLRGSSTLYLTDLLLPFHSSVCFIEGIVNTDSCHILLRRCSIGLRVIRRRHTISTASLYEFSNCSWKVHRSSIWFLSFARATFVLCGFKIKIVSCPKCKARIKRWVMPPPPPMDNTTTRLITF